MRDIVALILAVLDSYVRAAGRRILAALILLSVVFSAFGDGVDKQRAPRVRLRPVRTSARRKE